MRWGLDQVMPVRVVRGLGARVDAELAEDIGDVGADRGSTDEERLRDLQIGAAGNHEAQHLRLAWGQPTGTCPGSGSIRRQLRFERVDCCQSFRYGLRE